MNIKKLYIVVTLLLLLNSCKRISFPLDSKGELLARVERNELYLKDVESIFYDGVTEKDSVEILHNYVDKWVKTQIKINEATKQFEDNNEDIEKLISEYRNTLLINKYDSYHSNNIDTVITNKDISEYYDLHKKSFRLSNPIVKGAVAVYPKKYRGEKALINLLMSNKEEDRVSLADLIEKNELKLIEFNEWTYFTEVLQNIPFNEKQFDDFLKKNKKYEIEDQHDKYVMVINSYKNSGEYTPQQMVESVIKKMIINSRKNTLIRQVEDSIYNYAIIEGDIEINSKEENNKVN